jgi:uncharacterized protein YrzB (UPF0473 family)
MSDEFGGDLFSISDDEGNEFVLEHLDTVELDGSYYLAFLPTEIDEKDENYGMIILKALSPDVNADLVVPTEEETGRAYEAFIERLYSEDEDADVE